MNVDEGNQVLAAARGRLSPLTDPSEDNLEFVHGVQVVSDEFGAPLVQIVLEHGKQEADLPLPFQNITAIDVAGRDKPVPVVYVNQSRFRTLGVVEAVPEVRAVDYEIRPGMQAQAKYGRLSGTIGWGFMINNEAYVLSNWHIFCPDGNNTQGRHRINIGGFEIAELAFFEPMDMLGNRWDLAIAKLDDPAMLLGEFNACARSRTPYVFPVDVETQPFPQNDPQYTSKSTKPYCAFGDYLGVADVNIQYDDGTVREFVGQLLYSPFVGPGDSGCLSVRFDNGTAAGLFFCKNDTYGVANPLYQRNWVRVGTMGAGNGTSVPDFQSIDRYP